jgi:hypothetical protein
LLNHLDLDSDCVLRQIALRDTIKPLTYRVNGGQCILLGAMARIDVPSNSFAYLFSAYVSRNVPVHVTTHAKADQLLGNPASVLKIPNEASRALSPNAKSRTYSIEGTGWKQACVDIVFSGLGWVAMTGCLRSDIRVSFLGDVQLRSPIMRFDGMLTAKRFTG